MSKIKKFAGTLKDSMHWWLSRQKSFILNDEYKLELLYIDTDNYTAKIRITNLKDGVVKEEEVNG